jgi:hypothetical protein
MDNWRCDELTLDLVHEAVEATGSLCHQRGDEPGRDRRPQHGRHRLCGALDREVLAMEQVEGGCPDIASVGSGRSGLSRERPRGHVTARAPSTECTVLGGDQDGVGRVEHLAALEAFVGGTRQIHTARIT